MSTEVNLIMTATILLVTVATLVMGTIEANAQKNITSIMGLNAQNINNAVDNQHRAFLSAMLHNKNGNESLGSPVSIASSREDVLICIQVLLTKRVVIGLSLPECDGIMVNQLSDNATGDNKTMTDLQYAYLKARGIQ
jgi:hypothetical protein